MCRLSALTLSLTAAVAVCADAYAETPKHLLFFGNSFTLSHDVPGRLWQIAQADGHIAPRTVSDLTGGTDLDYHISQILSSPANNVAHPAVGPGETWDFVILQGYSTEATHVGDVVDFRNDAVALTAMVRRHPSGKGMGTRTVMYETWARGPTHAFYPDTFASPTAMQQEIRTSYQAATADIDAAFGQGTARYAPVGDAYEATGFDLGLYGTDIYHPSEYGATLNALILYRTIYDELTTDIPYSDAIAWFGLDSTQWTSLTALADSMPVGVPEPGMTATLAAGAIGLLRRHRRA